MREKKRASLSHNETLQKLRHHNSLTAYNIFSKFRLLPVVAVLSFVLVIIRIPNFFDENQIKRDISVIATPARRKGIMKTLSLVIKVRRQIKFYQR